MKSMYWLLGGALFVAAGSLFRLAPLVLLDGPGNNVNDLRERLRAEFGLDMEPTTRNEVKSLALITPSGLLGGYRNQYLRFLSFVVYAQENNFTHIYLPSVEWVTQLESIGWGTPWYGVPMDILFDVNHWNLVAGQYNLPVLSSALNGPSDCWESIHVPSREWDSLNVLQQSSMKAGTFRQIRNATHQQLTDPEFNPRKVDFLPMVENCTNPAAYGGGKQFGRLWNDYMRGRSSEAFQTTSRSLVAAMRVAPVWREVATDCVTGDYVVVHTRIELEMFVHACGKEMERSLPKIMTQLQNFLDSSSTQVDAVVIAVSRAGMEANHSSFQKFAALARENLDTLDLLSREGLKLQKGAIPVRECGQRILQSYYEANPSSPDYGAVLQSVLNFHLACEAKIFVGVTGSSYSTEVWTARYWAGLPNFRYTKDGIVVPVEGKPKPHKNCKKGKRKG